MTPEDEDDNYSYTVGPALMPSNPQDRQEIARLKDEVERLKRERDALLREHENVHYLPRQGNEMIHAAHDEATRVLAEGRSSKASGSSEEMTLEEVREIIEYAFVHGHLPLGDGIALKLARLAEERLLLEQMAVCTTMQWDGSEWWVDDVNGTQHCAPTLSEAIRKAAGVSDD